MRLKACYVGLRYYIQSHLPNWNTHWLISWMRITRLLSLWCSVVSWSTRTRVRFLPRFDDKVTDKFSKDLSRVGNNFYVCEGTRISTETWTQSRQPSISVAPPDWAPNSSLNRLSRRSNLSIYICTSCINWPVVK